MPVRLPAIAADAAYVTEVTRSLDELTTCPVLERVPSVPSGRFDYPRGVPDIAGHDDGHMYGNGPAYGGGTANGGGAGTGRRGGNPDRGGQLRPLGPQDPREQAGYRLVARIGEGGMGTV